MTFTCFGQAIPVVRLVALAALLGAEGFSGEAWAQSITVDGRLSPAQTLAGPNYAIGAGLGRQVGGNLFHSFGAFGLKGGETATFSGPASVGNVIGRVTGGAASSIDGGIRSTIPGASLYLVNPAGVVFGPNASVDVSGSFHASSADYLRMRDGTRFAATNPDASTLSAAPPEAFGFLSAPRPVTVNGSNLQLLQNRALGLVGGDVTISGGVLRAPSGTVHVASAAGPGEVPVDPRAGPAPTVARSGRVQVANKANIRVDGTSAGADSGSVYIRAGDLSVANSAITADNRAAGPGGAVSLHGDRTVALSNGATVRAASSGAGRGPGISIGTAASGAVTLDAATVSTTATAAGDGGAVTVNTGALTLQNGAVVLSRTTGRGNGGPINAVADSVLLDGSGFDSLTTGSKLVNANGTPTPAGAGGSISLTGGRVSIQNGGGIEADTSGSGAGGPVSVSLAGDMSMTTGGQILTLSSSSGDAGPIAVRALNVTLRGDAAIQSAAPGTTQGNAVTVAAVGSLVLESQEPGTISSIQAISPPGRMEGGGSVLVTAQSIALLGSSLIRSITFSPGRSGAVTVEAQGDLTLDARGASPAAAIYTGVVSGSTDLGNAGPLNVSATNISLLNGALITSLNFNSGAGGVGDMAITAKGALTLSGGSAIEATTSNSSDAATIRIAAKELTLSLGGQIINLTRASGNAGEIVLNVEGALTITGAEGGRLPSGVSSEAMEGSSGSAGRIRVNAGSLSISTGVISSSTRGTGAGGSVVVATLGALQLDGEGVPGTGIAANAFGRQSGDAGTVTIDAGTIAVQNGAQISSSTTGTGRGGNVTVNAGTLTLSRGGSIASVTAASGDAGKIGLNVGSVLTIDGADAANLVTAVSSAATEGSSGSAGTVQVKAGNVVVLGGTISSSTAGTGVGGSVLVETPGALLLDGQGMAVSGIFAQATGPQSGDAGPVAISAGAVAVQNGAQIAGSTAGPGRGGSVTVNTGTLALARGGAINSETAGPGNAGEVALNVGGALTLDGDSAVSSQALPGSSGSAGSVRVNAGSVSVLNGGMITTSTAGTGAGGSVRVATPGALLLDGGGGTAGTGITASATGLQSGDGGSVTVSAGTVTVQNGAQIASSTAGPGQGGDVTVNAASAIRLSSPGPQVSATAARTGDAGSVAVAAPQVFLRNGASISTAALEANGGNITVGPGDLLYLQQSAITTSVGGALGNGGNIAVAPQLVVLDRSAIQANAVGGNGGNVSVQASQLVQSFDSAITATSQRGVSGEILVAAQPLNLNGSLVVLASDLRAAAALLREGCAVRGASPRSSLVAAGRGGQRQGLDATLPALYFAHRPVRDGGQSAPDALAAPERISLGLSSSCG